MPSAEETMNVLNELLRAEAASLVPRLAESKPFVSWASADEFAVIGRLISEEREHQRTLIDCILNAGGAPAPITADLSSANVHYLELHYLFPRIIENKQRLVGLYEAAADRIDANSDAGQHVRRILAAKCEHLAALQRVGQAVAAPAES